MAAHWECKCGERFEQYPGYMEHKRDAEGEGHGLRGLIDDDSSEVLATNLRQAVRLGLVSRSAKRQGKASTDGEEGASGDGREAAVSGTTIRGRFVTREVLLDGRLLLLYDLICQRFPEYNADPGTWIFHCITQLYVEHADELALGQLFEDTMRVEVASG